MSVLRWNALLLLLLAPAARSIVLPTGTELEVRLKTKVASNASKPGDAVEATLIRPVVIDDSIVVAAGTMLSGKVKSATAIANRDEDRAYLELQFSKLGGVPVETQLKSVDNAREKVDQRNGMIAGILASETLAARMDQGVASVAKKYSGLGGLLQTVKSAVLKEPDPEIVYEPGVEMVVALTKAVQWNSSVTLPTLEPVTPEEDIYMLVNAQPVQSTATNGVPSDLTTLMFIGTEDQLNRAFTEAGWASAAKLGADSGLETFRAVAEQRGYKEAPMSILLLDGQKPDLVFQKQNNTFAMRHHLRIWKRPGEFDSAPIWVCAATHDIGISFSAEKRTFIHLIDSEIDRERGKVVGDLVLTGRVAELSLVTRPAAPQHSQNATGDKLETDGRMAVLRLTNN